MMYWLWCMAFITSTNYLWAQDSIAMNYPKQYDELDAALQDEATIVAVAAYDWYRGPCQRLPNGTRRWARVPYLTFIETYRGNIPKEYTQVKIKYTAETRTLERNKKYLVLLKTDLPPNVEPRHWKLKEEELLYMVPID